MRIEVSNYIFQNAKEAKERLGALGYEMRRISDTLDGVYPKEISTEYMAAHEKPLPCAFLRDGVVFIPLDLGIPEISRHGERIIACLK